MGFESAAATFRLSVWRPAQLDRSVDYYLGGKGEAALFDSSRLQEQLYQWNPGLEDILSSVANQQQAQELRRIFFEEFAPHRSPSDRSIEKFAEVTRRLRDQLVPKGVVSWSDVGQEIEAGNLNTLNLRANLPLSMLSHLEWIVEVFGEVPGASIAIR